jgi:hypothetical protein
MTGTPGFGQPACPSTVIKGGVCGAADPQLCYKTCGPQSIGAKYEQCSGGVYVEMSGCSFDTALSYACYKLPTAANTMCPAGTPQGTTDCAIDQCILCNSYGGLPGGYYADSAGTAKIGYCVCAPPNAAGRRTWSCASDTAWPCPGNTGC